MHTQNDIQFLIESTSQLNANQKKRLYEVLPELYRLVSSSVLLDERLAEDVLVMLPLLSPESVDALLSTLRTEDQRIAEGIEQLEDPSSFFGEIEQFLRSSSPVLQGAEKTLQSTDNNDALDQLKKEIST